MHAGGLQEVRHSQQSLKQRMFAGLEDGELLPEQPLAGALGIRIE
jgi:hypothetical protein